MKFVPIPSVFPEMQLFGACCGQFTFVISKDGNETYSASVKGYESKPFDGTLGTLGYQTYKTFDEAKAACEKFIHDKH